jgi:predicted amidohydrolase YtcJ
VNSSPDSTLLIIGARVYTADPANPWAEAVVVRGNTIAFVGCEADARNGARGAEEIRLRGGLLVPGLNDAHVHINHGSYNLTTLSFEGVFEVAEVQRRLREYAAANPDRAWIEGWGLPYEPLLDLPVPREALDEAVPDRPVLITAFDGHSAWCNTAGLRAAGIERGADVPLPNEVVVDPATGLATGMLKEGLAKGIVQRAIGEPTEEDLDNQLCGGMRHLNRLGVTSVADMMSNRWRLEQVERLLARGDVTVRHHHYIHIREEMPRDYVQEAHACVQQFTGPWNRTSGIKMFIDGVVEAKTAWMTTPYADGTDDVGVPDMNPDYYREVCIEAHGLGMDIATHAIGEQGVRWAVQSYIAAQEAAGGRHGRRHRVEHIETSHPEDLPLFGQYRITASMQPLHAAPTTDPRDTPWTHNVGPQRESNAFPWRRLLELGAPLAFGSDWPVVTADVRTGLHTAVARKNQQGEPAEGWQPQLSVTLSQALDAYTTGAAYAEGQDHHKGMLRAGMLADIAAFGHNLFAIEPAAILTTPITLTVVDGRVVHREL